MAPWTTGKKGRMGEEGNGRVQKEINVLKNVFKYVDRKRWSILACVIPKSAIRN